MSKVNYFLSSAGQEGMLCNGAAWAGGDTAGQSCQKCTFLDSIPCLEEGRGLYMKDVNAVLY